jgi:hypothetical protein
MRRRRRGQGPAPRVTEAALHADRARRDVAADRILTILDGWVAKQGWTPDEVEHAWARMFRELVQINHRDGVRSRRRCEPRLTTPGS